MPCPLPGLRRQTHCLLVAGRGLRGVFAPLEVALRVAAQGLLPWRGWGAHSGLAASTPGDREIGLHVSTCACVPPVDLTSFVTHFEWDMAKYPAKQPLVNVVDTLAKVRRASGDIWPSEKWSPLSDPV